MCVIFAAFQKSRQYPFILAANRDEYYQRPTATANFWTDFPEVLAGRDLEARGTWLGMNRNGKVAAITNQYTPESPREALRSRGELVSEFLIFEHSCDQFGDQLCRSRTDYNGYGMLFGDFSQLRYQTNRSHLATSLRSGIHALSNSLLNLPWPRVQAGKRQLTRLLDTEMKITPESLFQILSGQQASLWPQSVGRGKPMRSTHPADVPVFVRLKDYGTRSSTVILIDRNQNVLFEERTVDEKSGGYVSNCQFEFRISGPVS